MSSSSATCPLLAPRRARDRTLAGDQAITEDAPIAGGAEKARAVAAPTLELAHDRVGFLPPAR